MTVQFRSNGSLPARKLQPMWLATAGLALSAACGTAQAQQSFDATHCFFGSGSAMFRSDDVTIGSFDHKGIYRSNIESKVLDGNAIHCMGMAITVKGKRSMRGACRIVDPNGDMIALEIEDSKQGTGTAKAIGGTGAWKGVSGGGDWQIHTSSKPLADGTYQSCLRYHGAFILPK